MDKKCMYCMHISQFFDGCNLFCECKYEPNFIAKRFIEELEKIKDEIKANRDEWIKGKDAEWHTYDRCIYIIDKHIAELKGENK